jgi:hypothetical protein
MFKIIELKKEESFDKKRSFGMQKAKGSWVLYIDADERVDDLLRKNIQSQISNFSIYPNPTKNILTIQNPQFKITNLKIFNTLGKEITISKNHVAKNKNETQLNISSLRSGIYLLRLTDEKGNFYSAKFVKE